MIDRHARDKDKEAEKAIEEFLANGGEITYCKAGERSESIEYTGSFYAKRRKKKEESDD